MKFLTGLVLIIIGGIIIHYRYQIYNFTGEWEWANKYVHDTALAIALIGMILIGMGAAYPFGAFDGAGTANIMSETNSLR